ncbi:MAG: response regulator [Chloroflexi bacterium]|nr:response regulator [Chloroflexota bacterium]OJV89430.1 MAG: hypothetical protein BGO39_36245 [Chloroflexi bacterium 54-19]
MSQTIILVENQPDIREINGSLLQQAGYNVISEENAVEALRRVNRDNVDLIVTEINLPEMDGNQFIKELSRLSYSPPVLVLTKDIARIATNPLIKEVLQKPFTCKQLRQLIDRAISHS